MFASRIALAALALANVALAGAPPVCLLGAIQGLPNPADMKAVCDTYQTSVTGNLTVLCAGDDVQSAYSAYSATCSLNGVKVKALATSTSSADASSATGKTTAKATGTTTGTATGMTTATAKATSSTASKTGTSTATASGADASSTGETTTSGATASQPGAYFMSGLVALGVANMLML